MAGFFLVEQGRVSLRVSYPLTYCEFAILVMSSMTWGILVSFSAEWRWSLPLLVVLPSFLPFFNQSADIEHPLSIMCRALLICWEWSKPHTHRPSPSTANNSHTKKSILCMSDSLECGGGKWRVVGEYWVWSSAVSGGWSQGRLSENIWAKS